MRVASRLESLDAFRGVTGTFDRALEVLGWAREVGLPVQVNSTVTRQTLPHLPALYALLRDRAAPPVRRWSLFLLVPMGRGAVLRAPDAAAVERLFEWVYEKGEVAPFHVSTVEAPRPCVRTRIVPPQLPFTSCSMRAAVRVVVSNTCTPCRQ